MQLQIETTAHCQARCVMCPHPALARPRGTMAAALYQRIIDEAATIPRIDHVTLCGLGEPLIDPQIIARVAYARARLPHAVIDTFSNGHLLTADLARALKAAGLSVLHVSLNGITRRQRHAIMGLDDYDVLVPVLDAAIAAQDAQFRVVVKSIISKDLMEIDDADHFVRRWGGRTSDGGSAFLHLEGNWAGSVGAPMRVPPVQPCGRALDTIMVLWDGRVSLCCFDAECAVKLGDLTRQSLREVYDGQPALGIREAHAQGRRSEVPLCAGCTSI